MRTTVEGSFLRVRAKSGMVEISITMPDGSAKIEVYPHEAKEIGCEFISAGDTAFRDRAESGEAQGMAPESPRRGKTTSQ